MSLNASAWSRSGCSRQDLTTGIPSHPMAGRFCERSACGQDAPFGSRVCCKEMQTGKMKTFKDPLLLVLVGILAVSLLAFLTGALPYPSGLLVLSAFIAARIFHNAGSR